ncbi:MAG: aminoacyl-tRNA hydrolase [Myxococcota bacterium]|nr:aminoacyl-tRNA hydrolase [Myxococcota bacterium]MDW8362577.1 aminoacyl-tRNA hydrolase [Myxococcales bacterium]
MPLVVGLGNPGAAYANTRHNVGFLIVERLAERLGATPPREKFRGLLRSVERGGRMLWLLEPQTYMNLSGESVRRAMDFYKIPLAEVVVAHDEMDLPFGAVRVKVGGGFAGHNGLRSIGQHCGGSDFVRVRFGVDRPRGVEGTDHVLSPFDPVEQAMLPERLEHAASVLLAVIDEGPERAANRFNQRADAGERERRKGGR